MSLSVPDKQAMEVWQFEDGLRRTKRAWKCGDRPGGVECAHIATFMYTQHTHCYAHSVVLTNTCTYTHNDTHSHCKTMQDRLGQDVGQLAQFEHYTRQMFDIMGASMSEWKCGVKHMPGSSRVVKLAGQAHVLQCTYLGFGIETRADALSFASCHACTSVLLWRGSEVVSVRPCVEASWQLCILPPGSCLVTAEMLALKTFTPSQSGV